MQGPHDPWPQQVRRLAREAGGVTILKTVSETQMSVCVDLGREVCLLFTLFNLDLIKLT